MSDRVEQIEARLVEANDYGVTRWHADGCTYARTDGQWDCDCMRGDVEYLVDLVKLLSDREDFS